MFKLPGFAGLPKVAAGNVGGTCPVWFWNSVSPCRFSGCSVPLLEPYSAAHILFFQ